jgi:hypothetical protein
MLSREAIATPRRIRIVVEQFELIGFGLAPRHAHCAIVRWCRVARK